MAEEWQDLYYRDGSYAGRHLRGNPIPKGCYHRIVTVFTVNQRGKVLLTQRSMNKSYAGQWETTAGSVLEGEEVLSAARRELEEETGIVADPEDLVPLGVLETTARNAWMHAFFYRTSLPEDHVRLQEGETMAYRWTPLDWSLVTNPSLAKPVQIRFIYFWQQLITCLHPQGALEPWLKWAEELQSLAQQGLEYSRDVFDQERFQRIRDLSCEIMETKTGLSSAKVLSLFANEEGYQTPKVEVRSVLFRGDRILLVHEKTNGRWSLPGGWCDLFNGLGENAVKECQEESGLSVSAKRLIAIENRSAHEYTPYPYEVYKCYVLCEEAKVQDLPPASFYEKNTEVGEIGFFSLDQLPPLSEDRISQRALRMCWEAKQDPDWQTKFD